MNLQYNAKNELFLRKFSFNKIKIFEILNQLFMSTINWKTVKEFEDITYKKCDGVARIAFNRPDVRNAFRPKTTK